MKYQKQQARAIMKNIAMTNDQEGLSFRALTNVTKPSPKVSYIYVKHERMTQECLDCMVQEYRSYLCNAALNAVWYSLLWDPRTSTTHEAEQTNNFHVCCAAMNLLECLTISEFV